MCICICAARGQESVRVATGCALLPFLDQCLGCSGQECPENYFRKPDDLSFTLEVANGHYSCLILGRNKPMAQEVKPARLLFFEQLVSYG